MLCILSKTSIDLRFNANSSFLKVIILLICMMGKCQPFSLHWLYSEAHSYEPQSTANEERNEHSHIQKTLTSRPV